MVTRTEAKFFGKNILNVLFVTGLSHADLGQFSNRLQVEDSH
jgi:hypothetical protein